MLYLLLAAVLPAATTLTAPMPLTEAPVEVQQVVGRVVGYYGGDAAMKRLRILERMSQTTAADGSRTDFLGVSIFPDSYYAKIRTPRRELIAVATPTSAHVLAPDAVVKGAAMKLNPTERASLLTFFDDEPLNVLRNRTSSSNSFALVGHSSSGGKSVDLLRVLSGGLAMQWDVDSVSGQIQRIHFSNGVRQFSDWKDVGGVMLPHAYKTERDGKIVETARVSYALNPQIDASALFTAPTLWVTRHPLSRGRGGNGQGGAAGQAGGSSDGGAYAGGGEPDYDSWSEVSTLGDW